MGASYSHRKYHTVGHLPHTHLTPFSCFPCRVHVHACLCQLCWLATEPPNPWNSPNPLRSPPLSPIPPAVNSSLTGHPSKLASPPPRTAWPSLPLLPPLAFILPILFTKPHSSENDHIFINLSSFSSSLSILFS